MNKLPKRFSNICDWTKIKYPVFSYKKQTRSISREIKNISLLLEHMVKLQNMIASTQKIVEEDGKRLNIFINNIFNIKPKFNFRKHFLLLRNGNIEIHDTYELNDALVQNEIQMLRLEEQDELYDIIEPGKRTYKATAKQFELCQKLSNTYLEHYDEFELYKDDYDNAVALHDQLIETIKEELTTTSIINLTPADKIEQFNEEVHDIIAIRNNNTLEIFFTRKENKDDLLQRILQ